MDLGGLALGIIGGLVAASLGSIVLYLVAYFKVSEQLKKGQEKAGNYLGFLVYKNVLSKIKDEKLRAYSKQEFLASSDNFDIGWENGLNGIKQ